jgi:cytidine deaminase
LNRAKEDELASAARKAMKNAYAPYSHLNVGAAVLASDGRVFSGCNVENASFASTICAERSAIASAVSQGVKSIEAVVIVSTAEGPLLPCGNCLQTISEFASGPGTKIVSVGSDSKISRHGLGKLFPSGAKVHRAIKNEIG